MHAKTLASRGISGFCVLALALMLASCSKIGRSTYTVGGTVSGLTGTGLVLQNNGGDNLAISANGAFTFSRALKKDASYSVTVLTQPSGQSCTVTNGTGSVSANVTNVAVNCVTNAFTVGGTVSGLTGTGLVLQNNGGNDRAISANGAFTFSTALANGTVYSVTVLTQPSGQSCTVTNGAGTVSANVTNVAVSCIPSTYTIGGTVSGVTGTGLVLQNNGGNDRAIAADGAFTFSIALAGGASYSVTVLTPPSGEGCSVTNGSGSVASANVTDVVVTCAAPPSAPTLGLAFGVKELQFSWASIAGATFYRLLENPDGGASFNQVATNITALSYNHTIPVHRRVNASYVLAACNAGGCTPSVALALDNSLTQAIGYVKASNTGLGDQFGFSVALSGDGNTLAVGTPNEDSSTTGINTSPNESAAQAGAVYVYTRSAGAWIQQAYVKASNAGAGDTFGSSVALSSDGNTLAVGAPAEASSSTGINSTPNELAAQAGAAYVYARNAGTWLEQAYVKASNTGATDLFGISVALSGDGNTLAVGAFGEASSTTGINTTPDELAPFAGAAYVYTRSGSTWSQQAYVKASNTESGDAFGGSVALSGDGNTLAVGAFGEASSTTGINSTPNELAPGAGAVYVYNRSGSTWAQQAYVKASNSGDGDNFGTSVALSGDGNTLAVGAPFEDSSTPGVGSTPNELTSDAGAVYVYTRSGSTWSHQAYVKASNPDTNFTGGRFIGDQFGSSVALSADGNTLAAGAIGESSGRTGVIAGVVDETAANGNGALLSGAVYVLTRSGASWSQQTYVKASNTGDDDRFGTSVALSSDGNTLAVGARFEDGGGTGIRSSTDIMANPNDLTSNAGAVYLY
jgi:hypothetical protein